jgi:hypothetical protein
VLLVIGVEHVGDHAERDGATSGTKTTQKTRNEYHVPFVTGTSENLPKVNGAQRQLHHPEPAILLRPGCPKLASEAVQDQEPGHAGSGIGEMIFTKVVLLVESADSIGVYRRVEVYQKLTIAGKVHSVVVRSCLTHARLAQSHDSQHGPFLPFREGVGRVLKSVHLCEDLRGVGIDRRRRQPWTAVHGSHFDLCRGDLLAATV